MTVECKNLIEDLGFDSAEWKTVEFFLTKASPQRIKQAVKRYGKGVTHSAEWYKPLFNGYIKSDYAFSCSFDEDFWKIYQVLDSLCEIHTFDLPLIDDMRKSFVRFRKALSKAQVMNIRYIYKVWQSLPEEKIVNNINQIQHEFKSGVTRTVEI